MDAPRVIVIFPDKADLAAVERFRSVWDPLSGKVAAHVTLVYPFVHAAEVVDLVDRLEAVAARHSPFPMLLSDPVIVDREYLFLIARKGDREIRQLRDDLYVALPDAQAHGLFIPHMTIGRCTDPGRIESARLAASTAGLEVSGMASKMSIYRVGQAGDRLVEAVVPLGGSGASSRSMTRADRSP